MYINDGKVPNVNFWGLEKAKNIDSVNIEADKFIDLLNNKVK